MIKLWQRDPLWANVKIGRSNLTISKYGCALTCVSMLSDYFGCFQRPDDIATKLDWFTPDGLILWTKLNFSKMAFVWRFYKLNTETVNAAVKDPNLGCILNVDNGSHWVCVLSKIPFLNIYRVFDPWENKVRLTSSYKNITGGAIFRKRTN